MKKPGAHATYIVDTSIVVKWYVEREEQDLRQALDLLEIFGQGRCSLGAPELLVFELANALSSRRELKPPEVLEALNHLRGLGLRLEALRWETFMKAVEIASARDTTVYDAYFLAIALESSSTLVTADQAFLRKVRGYPGVVSLQQLRLPA